MPVADDQPDSRMPGADGPAVPRATDHDAVASRPERAAHVGTTFSVTLPASTTR